MITEKLKPYIRISTPDDKYFVWVSRANIDGRSYMISNFDTRTEFADALDRLGYLTVERIRELDDEMYSIVFQMKGNAKECLQRLVEDIPNIMDGMDFFIQQYSKP